jgi:hypothetical protein
LIGGVLAIIALVVMFGLSAIKNSDIYKVTLQQVQNSPAAQQQLGTPIEGGYLVSGNININNSSGSANFSIPVSGPKGSGTARVQATLVNNQWNITSLVLEVTGQPAPVVIVPAAGQGTTPGALESPDGGDQAAPVPAPASAPGPSSGNIFTEPGFYSMRYPTDWSMKRIQSNVVVFTRRGSLEENLSLVLQYLPTTAAGGTYADVDAAARGLAESLMQQFPGSRCDAPVASTINGRPVKGFKAELPSPPRTQVFVLAPRADGRAICVWFYRSPNDAPKAVHDEVQTMLDSWLLDDGGVSSTTSEAPLRRADDDLEDLDSKESRDPLFSNASRGRKK